MWNYFYCYIILGIIYSQKFEQQGDLMQSKSQLRKSDEQPPQVAFTSNSFNWLTTPDTKTWLDERDACALVASIRKNGDATHGNLKRAMTALSIMGHRSGEVNGEGDGCGVMTDIPRLLWAQALEKAEHGLAGGRSSVFCGSFNVVKFRRQTC